MTNKTFGELLKLHRKKSRDPDTGGDLTQAKLIELLSDMTGLPYVTSSISRWENNKRHIAKDDRQTLVGLLCVFYQHGGITAIEEAETFLQTGGYGALSDEEIKQIESRWLVNESNERPQQVNSPEDRHQPSSSSLQTIFTNIWYTDRRYTFKTWVRDYTLGTLYIQENVLHYVGERATVSIDNAESVIHTRQYSDINANWVKIVYVEDNVHKEAWFADGKKLGWGNLVGGSHELFVAIKRWKAYLD